MQALTTLETRPPLANTPVSEEQVSKFRRDGFLIVDTKIPEEILNGIVDDLSEYWGEKRPQNVSVATEGRIQDAWRISRNVHALATSPFILEVLQSLYGRMPLPFQTLNFPKGTEQRVHSDTIHFNTESFGYMCGVWVALEDIGPHQGPLIYYPGSHMLPEMNFPDFGLRASYDEYGYYETCIEQLISDHQFTAEYGVIRKGQAIIWAANLLHGGSFQDDKSQSRHSQVTHYYFENCRYWRPGYSQNRRGYFEPDWIPSSEDTQATRPQTSRISSICRALFHVGHRKKS